MIETAQPVLYRAPLRQPAAPGLGFTGPTSLFSSWDWKDYLMAAAAAYLAYRIFTGTTRKVRAIGEGYQKRRTQRRRQKLDTRRRKLTRQLEDLELAAA